MTTYDITGLDNTSGLLPIFTTIDQNAGGWFGGAFLLFLFLVFLITFRRAGNQDSFLSASALTTLIAGLGFGFGFITPLTLIFPVIMLVFSIMAKIWGEG
jgi:hypothetical protein